jgi:uncharacterized peroxidase-related enzyme
VAHHAQVLRAEGATDDEVSALCADPATAAFARRERAMVDFALQLTRLARPIREDDHAPLRAAGLDDDGIRQLVQVIAYFNYVNRHVEGLGVELEPNHPGTKYAELVPQKTKPR